MARSSFVQTSFLGGVWSATAQGRMDDPLYPASLNVCLNSIPLSSHSLVRRPGTRTMASTRAGKAGKLLPYVLGADEAYNIELTEGHLRFFQDGALLTSTETVVSNIALSGTVTQVTLPSGHGIVEGDNFLFIFNNEEGKTTYTELLNRQFFARNVTSTTVDIANAETGEILSDGFDSFATSDIILQKITDLSTPYSETQWPDVKIIQI